MKTPLTLAAALLATAACTNMASDRDMAMGQSAMSSGMTTTAAMPYMTMAGASDLYETQSSQLALTKSQDAQVRQFAQMMITDHANTTATLKAQAAAAGMTPPTPALTPMQRDNIAKLQPLTGAAFNREYMMQQGVSHQMALDLHRTYAASGDTPALRTAASAAVPIVQNHIVMHNRLPGAM